jgi:hypothetical protein
LRLSSHHPWTRTLCSTKVCVAADLQTKKPKRVERKCKKEGEGKAAS